MGGDPVPGPLDILREWFELSKKTGKERAEAIARLEEWLRKIEGRKTYAQGASKRGSPNIRPRSSP